MHRWCLYGPINSYHSFWWSDLILCLFNKDTFNICMKEFGLEYFFLTKWQLWELTDSSEILFSQILLKSFFFKNRVCWFELLLGKKTLAKTKFFHWLLLCGGVSNKHCLLTFFISFWTKNCGYFSTQFYGIESHASPLLKTESITSECILPIPWQTPVVSIALYRKMQSFGATLKFDTHF